MTYAKRRKDAMFVVGLVCLFFFVVIPLLSSGGASEVSGSGLAGVAGVWRYLTVVDAGSSGCRAHVFRWRVLGDGQVEVDPTHNNLKVKPGLSSFASAPSEAGASLSPLTDFMREEIPEEQWSRSPVFLKATAGLRMVDAGPREAILESVRDAIAASPFKFDDRAAGARVIAGTDEGGFGWMSVNYLMGNLDGKAKPSDYVGVIEMGGASAQVTQISSSKQKPPSGYEFDFKMGGSDYRLYTHSYLGYGLEQAREGLSKHLVDKANGDRVKDPCLNSGFAKAADDARADVYDGPSGVDVRGVSKGHDECKRAVEHALFWRRDACEFSSCSFNNVYQPHDLASGRLLVFENFYYTAKMLGTPTPDAAPKDFAAGAKEACELDWASLADSNMPKDGSDKAELNKLCFSATYLDLFLERGVGVPSSANVKVMQQVGDHGIDWSLGAAIKEASIIAHAEK